MPSPSNPPPAGARPRKILVVDDSYVIVKAIAFKLKSSGYDVCIAMDGAEAVSSVRREKPDLIVLDINFPPDVAHGGGVAWDGFLIMDWVRRIDNARHTPIILITSADAPKYKEQAFASGALAFFQKPINHDELLALIQQTLGKFDGPSHARAFCVQL
jgi:two-component system chemotaxis response regulator CheY